MSPQARSSLQGIAFMTGACAVFAYMDSMTRVAGAAVPMLMVLWWRYFIQALITTAVVLPREGLAAFRTRHPVFQVARGFVGVITSCMAFYCLQTMALANFTATWAVVPLLLVVTSALLFGERVSLLRWGLLLLGLASVFVIIRPEQSGEPLSWSILFPIALLGFGTAYQILGSRLAQHDTPLTIQLHTTWWPLLVMTAAVPFVWQPIESAQVWFALLSVGTCSAAGHLMQLFAYRRASPATVSPFIYTQIAFATLVGWALFGETPDRLTVLGILGVVVCGLASAALSLRERR